MITSILVRKYNYICLTQRIINTDTNELYKSAADVEAKTGISVNNIRSCCIGKSKTAGGYHWKYCE